MNSFGPGFACCLADKREETKTMAAVKNILMSNSSVSPDVKRPLSNVPFAPFLVFQKEAELSGLREPQEKAPPMANTDRSEHRSRG